MLLVVRMALSTVAAASGGHLARPLTPRERYYLIRLVETSRVLDDRRRA